MTTAKHHLSRTSRIEGLLKAAFPLAEISLRDESGLHSGHAGAKPEGETHFRLRMASPDFAGQSRIERQRRVNALLGEEFSTGLHALAMELKAPGEG